MKTRSIRSSPPSTIWLTRSPPRKPATGTAPGRIHGDTLTLVLMALGDALIGGALAKSLGLPRDAARERATAMLEASLADYQTAD